MKCRFLKRVSMFDTIEVNEDRTLCIFFINNDPLISDEILFFIIDDNSRTFLMKNYGSEVRALFGAEKADTVAIDMSKFPEEIRTLYRMNNDSEEAIKTLIENYA